MPFNPKSLQNLRNTGRPKGAISKATRWKMQLEAPGAALAGSETPTQVLAINMAYFQRKSEEFEREGKLEEACKLKQRANEAANLLAPYVHSKMPVLAAQLDEEAQAYVIRVPDALPDGQAWSHAVNDVKTITVDPQMNGSSHDD